MTPRGRVARKDVLVLVEADDPEPYSAFVKTALHAAYQARHRTAFAPPPRARH